MEEIRCKLAINMAIVMVFAHTVNTTPIKNRCHSIGKHSRCPFLEKKIINFACYICPFLMKISMHETFLGNATQYKQNPLVYALQHQ